MSESEKSRASFAFTFSDLMMGAMIIIIVLLLFLSVVVLRGQGVETRSSETVFPPGLRAKFGAAHARIRLIISPADLANRLKVIGVNNVKKEPPLELGGDGLLKNGKTLAVREIYLRQGLGTDLLRVTAKEELPKNAFVSVSVLIGGLLPQPTKSMYLPTTVSRNQDLFVIGLSKKEIIESAL